MRRAAWLILSCLPVLAAVQWGPQTWRRVWLTYYRSQCLRYTAPRDRVVCVEPGEVGWQWRFSSVAPDPPVLSSLLPLISRYDRPSGPGQGPVLFMHERRSAGGRRFLVIVRRTEPALRQSIDLPLSFTVTLIDPESGPDGAYSEQYCYDVVPRSSTLRFFAGQPDPGDETRFTIGYETVGEGSGAVEGCLRATTSDWPEVELRDAGPVQGEGHGRR